MLRETFTCEVCGDELPCLGFESRRAPLGQRSSIDYPNRLCAWCWRECLISDSAEEIDRAVESRDREIVAAIKDGAPVGKVAAAAGLTRQRVWQITRANQAGA